MRRTFALLLILICCSADARTLNGSLEFRVRSNLASSSAFGQAVDSLDYSWYHGFSAGEIGGAITQIYRADRSVGTATPDVLPMSGMVNAIGESVAFTTVKGLFVQNLDSAAVLTLSGIATATIPPLGALALTGDRVVASLSPALTISTTATASYRVWIVGE